MRLGYVITKCATLLTGFSSNLNNNEPNYLKSIMPNNQQMFCLIGGASMSQPFLHPLLSQCNDSQGVKYQDNLFSPPDCAFPLSKNCQQGLRMPLSPFGEKAPWFFGEPPIPSLSNNLEFSTHQFVKQLRDSCLSDRNASNKGCHFSPNPGAGRHSSRLLKDDQEKNIAAVKLTYCRDETIREKAAYKVFSSLGLRKQPAISSSVIEVGLSKQPTYAIFSKWIASEKLLNIINDPNSIWAKMFTDQLRSKQLIAQELTERSKRDTSGIPSTNDINTFQIGLIIDAVAINKDRHLGNMVLSEKGELILIDHDAMFLGGRYFGAFNGKLSGSPVLDIPINKKVMSKIIAWDTAKHSKAILKLGLQENVVQAFANRMYALQDFLRINSDQLVTIIDIGDFFSENDDVKGKGDRASLAILLAYLRTLLMLGVVVSINRKN